MSLGPTDIIALDTNALIHWVRQNATGKHILNTYKLHQRTDRPLVPSIVEGEIRGLAKVWKWGDKKIRLLDDILAELVRVDAGLHDIVLAYADLFEADNSGGHNTGQNDLWIAATAKAAGAVLLTCDTDFNWMNATHLRIEFVPPVK